METSMYHPTISVPLVYGPKDCGIFERDFRYIEDLVLRQRDTGISPRGISFEHLTGRKWDSSYLKDLS